MLINYIYRKGNFPMNDILTLQQAASMLGVSEKSLARIKDSQVSWSQDIRMINIHGNPHFRYEDIQKAKMRRENKKNT